MTDVELAGSSRRDSVPLVDRQVVTSIVGREKRRDRRVMQAEAAVQAALSVLTPAKARQATRLVRTPGGRRILRAKARGLIGGTSGRRAEDVPLLKSPPVHWTSAPIVSVIVPVHNQGRELVSLRQSLESQTLAELEVIVWDDGSTDPETIEFLDHWKETTAEPNHPSHQRRYQFFCHENKGVVATRNAALGACTGRYVCFLDPDDVLEPTYLEKATLLLEGNPGFDVAVPAVRLVGHPHQQQWEPEMLSWPEITAYNQIPIASLVMRSTVLEAGGFRSEFEAGWEDWDLWIRVAALGARSIRLPEALFRYAHSETEGRDAEVSRPNAERLQSLIHEMAPSRPKLPRAGVPRVSVSRLLDSTAPCLPQGAEPTAVFFIPWMIKGGGADGFVKRLAAGMVERGMPVVFVVTEPEIPVDAVEARHDLLALTPYVYVLKDFLDPVDFDPFISRLLGGAASPVAFCVGSPRYYAYLERRSTDRPRHHSVDVLFNDSGHIARHRRVRDMFDLVVAVHTRLARSLVDRNVTAAPVQVVPVGVDLIEPSPARPTGPLRVGWLGRLSVEKRPEWFIGVARECEGLAHFEMVGSGPLLADCRRQAQRIPNLDVSGFVDDLGEFWGSIDLLLITSSIEGIAVTALEAVQRGIPVVTTDVGGMRDLIVDGWNGHVADPNSFRSYASLVREVLSEPERLAKLSEQTRVAGLPTAFQADEMVDRYVEIARNLVSDQTGASHAG